MSDAHDQLARLLDDRFPGLTFPAVTHRNGVFPSLRFELGGELPHDTDDETNDLIEHAAMTAVSIFETAFAPDDDGFVSIIRWAEQEDDLFRALLPAGCDIARTEGEDFYEQDEPDTPYVAHTARVRPRSLNYQSLFELTASSELCADRSPALEGRCYLVNTTTPLIFHMYDDRAAMLVASRDSDLNELRLRYSDIIIP